jgi:hypothetical protein
MVWLRGDAVLRKCFLMGALDVGVMPRHPLGVLPPTLNAAYPQCRNAVTRLESWKIPCAGSDNARETEFGDGGRARTLPRPRLQWGEKALPVPRYEALPLPRYEASPLPRYEASPLPRIAEHCQLSALPMPGTIAAPSGTIRRWCRRHCGLEASRP